MTIEVIELIVVPKNRDVGPLEKTIWRFAGFEPGRPIYFHTRRGGRTYTKRIGMAKSPCGTLRKRLRGLPAWPRKNVDFGTYRVAVDTRRRYAPAKGRYAQYTFSILVFRKA